MSLKEIITITDNIVANSQLLVNEVHKLSMQESSGGSLFIAAFTIFILSAILGYFVIWRVTPALHTPLMSVTNAISGVVIVGAIIALGTATDLGFTAFLAFFAIIISSINIFGGFFISWRMISMFQKK